MLDGRFLRISNFSFFDGSYVGKGKGMGEITRFVEKKMEISLRGKSCRLLFKLMFLFSFI